MSPLYRRFFHLILAVFTANAANKFFIPNLEFELTHRFYQDIFEFHGYAPDQYRILPLLLLKHLWQGLKILQPAAPWNHAVLLFNFICAWAVFELFYHLNIQWSERKRLIFNLIFASLFIYTQYTAWRPDTLCLLALCLLTLHFWRNTPYLLLHLLMLAALAFSRADVAMVYGVFWVFYFRKNWAYLLPAILIPVAIQALLQKWIFPDAVYYTKQIMLWDNLGGFYLRYNPATFGIVAAVMLFRQEIQKFVQENWQTHRVLCLLFVGYFGMLLVFARINEYRLYLPFLPLFLLAYHYPFRPMPLSFRRG